MTFYSAMETLLAVCAPLFFMGTLAYICIRYLVSFFFIDGLTRAAARPLMRMVVVHQGVLGFAVFALSGICLGYRQDWLPIQVGEAVFIIGCCLIISVANVDRRVRDFTNKGVTPLRSMADYHAPNKE